MKRLFKFISITFLFGLLLSLIFFVWASSPSLPEKEYTHIITNNYQQTNHSDSIYSIVTYNIGYLSGMTNNKAIIKPKNLFKNNLATVKSEFKRLNADILAFQEIDYASSRSYKVNQQNELASLGYKYVAQAINWDENYVPFPYWPPSMHFGKLLSGQSILSKYPLKNHKRIVLQRVKKSPFYRDAFYLDRLAQVVTITIETKNIVLINVHLEAFDKQTRVEQFNDVITLFNHFSTTNPTILLGDFNSEAGNKEAIIHQLLNRVEIGAAALNRDEPENTYDSKQPFKRIDYIFYTKNSIEYIDGQILTQFGQASDHLPIFMKFKLKN